MAADSGRELWELARPPISPSDLVRRAAESSPDALALVDGPVRLSWGALDADVSRAAHALRHRGLDSGDRIALHVGTGVDFVRTYLGANRAGLVVVPLNPGYALPELIQILDDCDAKLLVTASIAVIQAADRLPVPQLVIAARSAPDGFSTLAELLAAAPDGPAPMRDTVGEQPGLLLYTSGTSGQPKGAMLSVRALMANLGQLAAIHPPLLSTQDVVYIPLPLFHIFGLNAGLGLAIWFRCTVVLTDRFDPVTTLATMAAEQVSAVIGAPTMFARWAGQPELADGFAAVRLALAGSAPLAPALVEAYGRVGVALHEGFGLTEAAPVVCTNVIGNRLLPKAGSVGREIPGVEVELRDADGEVADEQDPGEMFVRGANLFSGYWPDGAGGPDADGWFSTGDIALRDEDGDLYLVGRANDLIIVNGFNVYPAEVEAVLGAVEGVAEVAVLGEPDEVTGEAVRAFVVAQPGAELDPDALIEIAARSLARFKLPHAIDIVAALPHTATGKVMKWQLRPPAPDARGAHRATD